MTPLHSDAPDTMSRAEGGNPHSNKEKQQMSDTKPIAAVDPEEVHLPYTPSVKGRFKVVVDFEIEQIRERTTEKVNQIEADALAEIRQWEQMLDHVEHTVPGPVARVGRDPYPPDDEIQGHIDRVVELHNAQDAREGARR